MTSSIVEIDTTILDALDFEHEPPCEWVVDRLNEACDKAATWKMIQTCCGNVMIFCDYHKNRVQEMCEHYKGRLTHAEKFGGCGSKIPGLQWERL